MDRRRPPGTEEGWYALHDLRRIDWDAWRDAPEREQVRAIEEGVDYLRDHEALADADEGASAVFSIVGHKADLLILHLRPTLAHLDRAERRFESTALAPFTDRASSYVSVTEVSGYMHEELTEGLEEMEDAGMRNYMRQRIYPRIPDATHVCFYPMDKRRGPEHNWYDLPFEERAEYMSAHGEVGRAYAGKVTQIITGSVGLDDYEWGVTLFANDPVDIKHLLYEMRFDPSTSRYAEFGPFYVGQRFPPEDLEALFAGEAVPTDEALVGDALDAGETPSETGGGPADDGPVDDGPADGVTADDGTTDGETAGGGRPDSGPEHDEIDAATFREEVGGYDVDLSRTEAGYGLLFRSEADADLVREAVEELRSNFDHYDTHVLTSVRDGDGGPGVVSLWRNERAANIASGFLADLPGVESGVGAPIDGDTAESRDESGGEDGEEDAHAGGPPTPDDAPHEEIDAAEFERRVFRFGVDLDEHPEAGFALLFGSEADAEALAEEVDGLRGNFDHYDTHVLTTVRANAGDTAVVSLWRNERAASIAAGFLADLPGAGPGVGAALDDETDGETHGSGGETHGTGDEAASAVREELEALGVYSGQPHGEDVHAVVLYSEAAPDALEGELSSLRERFGEDDSHVKSAVYAEERDGGRSAVVSIWETQDAAARAGGDLADLPGVVERAGEESGFGTMGMFYTVKPEHREDFLATFGEVGEALSDMEGHLETRLFVNTDDENDTFIASQWREKDDALEFFRSEAFRETVQWGREILDDRPRHVFLA